MTIEGAFIIEALFWRINFKTSQHLMIENSLQSRVSVIAWFCNQLFWVSEVTVPFKHLRSYLKTKTKKPPQRMLRKVPMNAQIHISLFPSLLPEKKRAEQRMLKNVMQFADCKQFEFSGSCFFTSGPSLVYDYAVIDWSWLGNCVTIFNRWKMCMRMHENCPRYKNWDKMVFINNLCWLVSF